MRAPDILLCLAASFLAVPAMAASHASHPAHKAAAATAGPKAIGTFGSWEAATHTERGQKVCYAFTRASASTPKLHGRDDVVLTVTERPSGRDEVAISTGYAYPANAEVMMQVEQASFPFYTAQRAAFARDGHAVVAAFKKGRQATARGPGPHGQVVDTFPLDGFTAAYDAINKACPAH